MFKFYILCKNNFRKTGICTTTTGCVENPQCDISARAI